MPKILMLIVIYGILIDTPAADNARLPKFDCLPRVNEGQCPPDHEIAPCPTSRTKYRCIPCAPGLRMCDATSLDLPSKCYDPRQACSADGDNVVQVTDLPDGGCTTRCICNESAGFSGPDPLMCQSHDQACDQSSYHEFDSQHCVPCPENHHNPHNDGLDVCLPLLTPSSTAVKPQHTLHVPPTTQTPPTAASTTTTTASAASDRDSDSDNEDDMRSVNSLTDAQNDIGTRWYIWVSVSILLVGIIAIIAAICCYCQRKNGKTNAENHNCFCCMCGTVSSRNSAVVNQGLPASYELQPLQGLDTERDESSEQNERPVDPPGQPVDPPEQPVNLPGQPVNLPGQPVDPPYDPPPYSGQCGPEGTELTLNFDGMTLRDSGHMTERSPTTGPDTTQRKTESELIAGEVPTSQDGPCAMTAGTIGATPYQRSSLQGRLETRPKEVVQGHVAEASETEKKMPVLGVGPVISQRISRQKPVLLQPQSQGQTQPQLLPQSQAQHLIQHQTQFQTQTHCQPKVQSQSQGQPGDSVLDSGSRIPRPPSVGGESLHMCSFGSESTPTVY